MKKGWKPLDSGEPSSPRPDGSLSHRDVKKPNVDRPFMEHSNGATYERLEKISLKCGGALYIDRRYTEIAKTRIHHKLLRWLMYKLP